MTVKTITPEINLSTGRMAFALRLDGVHCGYAESYLDADTLAAEILAKREAAAKACTNCNESPCRSTLVCQGLQVLATPAPLQAAAYVAPRPTPRKAKVKKSRCACPQCVVAPDANGTYYCRAGKEWLAYHNGLLIAAGDFLPTEDALRNHRYALLTHPLSSDLDPEQAADVLAARGLEPTAN